MISVIDWWCTMCKQEGSVTDSVDVCEIKARVQKAHKTASPKCECVTPYYSRDVAK